MYQGKFVSNSKNGGAKAPAPRKKPGASRKSTAGSKIFYTVYALVMLLLCIGIAIGMIALRNWLVRFEASQPDAKAQQIFESHFSNPDWSEIYALANLEDTPYETAASFTAYMEQTCTSDSLTYVKTSAGLTGGEKYIVRMGDLNLATFTLQNRAKSEMDIPQWELEEIRVMMARNAYVSVEATPEQTVKVNGVALEPNLVVQTTSTVAENYLPSGTHGAQTVVYHLDGLLIDPEVTVTEADGTAVEMRYDAESKTYFLPEKEQVLPEGLEARMVSAVQNYCKYMIGAGGSLSTYFDTSSNIYKTITKNELWFRGYTGYEFTEATIVDPYVYSDNLASAKVCLDLNVSRSNGTIKTFTMDSTLFMQKQNGNWKIIEMVNVDTQAVRTQVRLVFSVGDQVVSDVMVDAASATLTLPLAEAPEGQVFAGWFRQVTDSNGKQTLKLVFQPDVQGKVTLPDGYTLEPMELIAHFEKEQA